MTTIDRRHFLKNSSSTIVALSAGTAALSARSAKAQSANEKIVVALCGAGGRGSQLIKYFAIRQGCEVAYICDPNDKAGTGVTEVLRREHNSKLKRVRDYRQVLEDKDVDAVVVATPEHWHGPLTIFACQAGKDVYVEKTPSHNIWEGRKMVEAARKYNRIVQVGTQTRSAPYAIHAAEYIRSGKLGNVYLCKVYNLREGGPYRTGDPAEPPDSLDWNLWLGPAPMRPYQPNLRWDCHWDFSGGDIAQNGIHILDMARWITGKDYPNSVICNSLNIYNDDKENLDMMVASFEFDNMVMTYEQGLFTPYMHKTTMEIRDGDLFPHWPTCSIRTELYGTKNMMVFGQVGAGWQVFDFEGKVVDFEYGRFPDNPHIDNFIACLRDRKLPNADIEDGHRSSLLVHLPNISYRVGSRKLQFDAKTERFVDDDEANQLVKRSYREPFVIPEAV